MPTAKSSPPQRETDSDSDSRANQKHRTRQALIDAVRALRDEGHNPTFAEVAERALVSRATAYRYFPSIEALISESATDRGMKPLERFWQPGDDPIEGIGRAANELNGLLIDDEIGLHVMERSFMTVWLESESHETPLRPGRRMNYIEPIVDSLTDVLTPAERKRLKQALSIVMGTEALIAVRDISRASIDEAVDSAAWAARSLVRQALAEAKPARRKRGTAPGNADKYGGESRKRVTKARIAMRSAPKTAGRDGQLLAGSTR
ncbi:TetR/AcrR family transcriptional regulator [Paraburkholderia sp. LEh10]|uniref:TetR/AcrR family transcriptional regulator n=1 Tax=Paraburkholderia sp. LEh10 TaxID=2821353 RepID=UPI001AE47888|nr:TetR/AcrR family transcriptional regulator [Paraburkholderia sp. LEh10]MBP0593014.1 TetR/AcrR family transcriptional regulator [Paraburkholderia sp. LEh10]